MLADDTHADDVSTGLHQIARLDVHGDDLPLARRDFERLPAGSRDLDAVGCLEGDPPAKGLGLKVRQLQFDRLLPLGDVKPHILRS